MDKNFYTSIGYTVVWVVKYIFVPILVAVIAKIIVIKLLKTQLKSKK